ncbi:MAG: hypothetical protein LBJ65_19060 [Burkholderia sp.]|nr:hypothetical protein [Burkholderia sp.]
MTDTTRTDVGRSAAGETGVAVSSSDSKAERRPPAAQGGDLPPVVALGEARAGWSALFNH